MKMLMSIIAVAAMIGFSAGSFTSSVGAQTAPPAPSPTDGKDKDKKPGLPRAGDDQGDGKKKDERGGR